MPRLYDLVRALVWKFSHEYALKAFETVTKLRQVYHEKMSMFVLLLHTITSTANVRNTFASMMTTLKCRLPTNHKKYSPRSKTQLLSVRKNWQDIFPIFNNCS